MRRGSPAAAEPGEIAVEEEGLSMLLSYTMEASATVGQAASCRCCADQTKTMVDDWQWRTLEALHISRFAVYWYTTISSLHVLPHGVSGRKNWMIDVAPDAPASVLARRPCRLGGR